MFCVTLFVFWLLRQVYHTTSRKNTPIRKNFPFFLRTCVPAMYARTQRLTRNAQYRGMQSKRQGTTSMVIPCLYSFLSTVPSSAFSEPLVNKNVPEPFFIKNRVRVRTVWWRIRDSNPRPPACDAGALTSWANPPYFVLCVPNWNVIIIARPLPKCKP